MRHFLCVKILWTPNWNNSKSVRNLNFGSKTILQSFRMTKIDHIPYPDHNFWMKIDCCGIWFLTPMDFHVFYTFCTVFLYWPLQSPLWGPFRRKKLFFRKSIISPRDVGISTECSKKVRCIPKDIPNRWYGYQNDIRGKTPFFRFSGHLAFSQCPSSPPRLVENISYMHTIH